MMEYENITFIATIGSLKAKIQKLMMLLESSVAPAFRGASLNREALEEMLSNIPKADNLTVFVPEKNCYIKMHFGDGTDVVCKGCDNFIDYTVYNTDFEEIDGGQMEYSTYGTHYCEDIRNAAWDVVDFACGSDVYTPSFIPLNTKS